MSSRRAGLHAGFNMFSDTALARRIEAAEALNAAGSGESIATCGGFASFAGVGSPLTHAIGLGMNGPIAADDFDRMEEFYRSRGSSVNLDFCPLADPSLMELVGARGYRIVESNNALVGPVIGGADSHVRLATSDEVELWNMTVLRGFFPIGTPSPTDLDIGRLLLQLDDATGWFAFDDGGPASGGAMNIRNKLALLFADSTLENHRGKGLHLALIRTRLKHAAEQGCDLATASTVPGSISQRNYERAGFRVAYTKLNLQRDWT
jgi:GNAT superfamily N-acetyltransferase